MKKHGLLKILGILLFLMVIVSFIFAGKNETVNYLGFGDVSLNVLTSIYVYFYIAIFILAVGGFYGVLNKTKSYKKLLDNIVTKVKPLEKKFVFFVIFMFAIIASLTGMTLPLIVFVPFVVAIILLLGYDKLVALSATIGGIIVGYIGGVFVTFVNPNSGVITTYETFVGTKTQFANMFPKLLLLFAGIALLIYFVNKHIINVEKKKVKYELSDNSELLINEVKGNYKDIKTWPLIVIFSLIFVILVLGMIPWNGLFKIDVFTRFHTWLLGLSIKDFAIIPNIISGDFPAFGEWSATADYIVYFNISLLLLFASAIVALVNKVKADEAIDGTVDGMKKSLPAVLLMMVAVALLICSMTNGAYSALLSGISKFNYGVSSLLAFLGCIVNVDLRYIVPMAFSPIVNTITDEGVHASVALLLQSIYGIFSLVGPTSLIMIFGLSYMDIPYTTWLKYIWRFLLGLIILVSMVTLLVVLL